MKEEVAVLAAGCFWCYEPAFSSLKGVISVEPGYAGGASESPSYEEVSSGETGHAEAVKVVFDPTVISYENILEVFWFMHDPTSLNKQGNDVGTQYRSAIFFTSNAQKDAAFKSKQFLEGTHRYDKPIVTEIVSLKSFYPAEEYHKKYFEKNPNQPYCSVVIAPKFAKFKEKFEGLLK
jgi:peptide-methionine (S)-S-oxide reductase